MDIEPGSLTAVALHLPATAEAPGRARAFLSEFVRAGGAEQFMDDGRLIVSELVTNAVEHGGGDVSVDLQLSGAGLEVGVRDDGPGEPRITPAGRRGLGGRGLALVARLAQDWGVQVAERGGKRVWCLIAVHSVRGGSMLSGSVRSGSVRASGVMGR